MESDRTKSTDKAEPEQPASPSPHPGERRLEQSRRDGDSYTMEERRHFIYRHVQFNHAFRTPEQLLEEHGDSRWELVRIVPYNGYESVLVLRSEE